MGAVDLPDLPFLHNQTWSLLSQLANGHFSAYLAHSNIITIEQYQMIPYCSPTPHPKIQTSQCD